VRGAGRIAIGTAYRPGSGLSPSAAIDALSESVSMFGYCDYILIFSDFNVDLLKPNVDAAPELLSFFKQQNLFQLVQEPTRVKNGSSTLLDLVITDSRDICKSVSVHHNHILSDHGLVMTEFNIKKPPIPPVFKWIRAINKIDNDLFLKDLHAMPWEDVNEQDNIDDMVKVFNYLLNLIFDKHAPLQKVKIKESPSPWITDNIKLMSLRDKALHRANRTQKESHFAYYKDMKNMVTSALRREKEAFFSHYVNKNKHKPQQMWNYLKKTSVLGNSTLPDIPPNLNNPDDINNFFLDVPGDSNIDENLLNYYKHNRFGSDDFNLHNTNMDEVSKIIRAITTNAAGWDTVTAEMLRMTLPVTLPIITRIINVSINDKIFPGDWKVAKIKPLPKSSSVKQLNDLRAISILPVMSKIIERVVCTQL
ncbi:unnamed protein product, partial [Plutella xylostella]